MVGFINIWGKRVGAVSWDGNRRLVAFEFDEDFIREDQKESLTISEILQF